MWLETYRRRILCVCVALLAASVGNAAEWGQLNTRPGTFPGAATAAAAAAAPAGEHSCALVCSCLQRHYLRHIAADAFLTAALSALHATEPRADLIPVQDGWRLRWDGQALADLRSSDRGSDAQSLCAVGHTLDLLLHDLGQNVTAERREFLAVAMVNAGCGRLDAYTRWLPPMRARNLDDDLAGCFAGIGAELTRRDDGFIFASVPTGLPADRAGIHCGDRLVAVAGVPVAGWDEDAVVARIHGPAGSRIALTVTRIGIATPVTCDVVRAVIRPANLRACRLDNVAYIRLDSMTADAAQDLRAAIAALQAAGPGPLAGLVLDLRGNRGGLVHQATEIAGCFLPRGAAIVRLVPAAGPPTTTVNHDAPVLTVPLAVLVSPATASAAELLAGTLQSHDRAAVIGTVTFGKGLVQALCDLPDGGICKCSVAEYRLPGNERVQDLGVMPDVALAPPGVPLGAGAAPALLDLTGSRYLAAPAITESLASLITANPEPGEDAHGNIIPDALARRTMAVLARTRGMDRSAVISQWRSTDGGAEPLISRENPPVP